MKYILCFLLSLYFASSYGQSAASRPNPHAILTAHDNHTIELSVTGAWPVLQMLSRLRREYGWVIDSEQLPQPNSILETRANGIVSPRMRTIDITITQPTNGSALEERAILEELAAKFSVAANEKYVVVANGPKRFDFVQIYQGSTPLLNTVISIKPQSRTIDQTIQAILEALSAATGKAIIRGGMADNVLLNTAVTVGGYLPARLLLQRALDASPIYKVWLLGYEPQDKSYAISIETAVKVVQDASGNNFDTLIKK
jgi:hypothetical protein